MITYLVGDPLLTRAQTLAFGYNARGRPEVTPLHTALLDKYPAAFASFARQCRAGRIKPGQFWLWTESQPRLLFLAVRESPVGMTRVRYVESVALTLARDYHLYNLTSLALAPLGTPQEWALHQPILEQWLARSTLPVKVYIEYAAGQAAEAAT